MYLYLSNYSRGDTCCVMIIVIRNRHNDRSSNPGRGCLHFNSTNTIGKGMLPFIPIPVIGR